jgi:hypothetical protein
LKCVQVFPLGETRRCGLNATWDCKNIAGFCALHFVTSVSPRDITLLKLQILTCFCLESMDDNLEFFEKISHVLP